MESPMALAHSCFGRFTKWLINNSLKPLNKWYILSSISFANFLISPNWQILFIYFVVVVVAIIHILHCKNMLFPKFFLDFFEKILKICNMKVLPFAKNQMHIFSSISSETFYKFEEGCWWHLVTSKVRRVTRGTINHVKNMIAKSSRVCYIQ